MKRQLRPTHDDLTRFSFYLFFNLLFSLALHGLDILRCQEIDLLIRAVSSRQFTMTGPAEHPLDEQPPNIWSLQSFNLRSFAAVGDCVLKLDRGTSEFGLLYKLDETVFQMAQFADNDAPVYFDAAWALAVCYRPKCKKVCVQFPNYQGDIEFEDFVDVQSFLLALKSHATKTLMCYEVPM